MALRVVKRCWTLFLACSLVACGDDGGGDGGGGNGGGGNGGTGGATVSYKQDVRPIFQNKCVYCHHPGAAIDVDLEDPFDAETGIVGRANTWVPSGSKQELIVDPGNVDNSFLITKVEETELDAHVDGSPMPLVIPRLTEDEFGAVEQWIRDGAKDDGFFAESVAPIFGTAITLGRGAGKCTFCHYPGTPFRMSVLDVFDPTSGMVNVNSAHGGKIVAPGDPEDSVLMRKLSVDDPLGAPMPLALERLTAAEITTLKAWILAGAQNN